MRKIRLALFWGMAALPCFGQQSSVIVKSTEVVQVSSSDESPNISRVNSVTIYYINCHDVVYCGPPTEQSSSTYTFTFGSTPLWATPPSVNSAIYLPDNITPVSSSGLLSISNGTLTTSPGPFSTSLPSLSAASDVGRMLGAMAGQPIITGNQPGFSWGGAAREDNLAISTANPSSLAASNYNGQINLASALVSGNNSLPLNEPSWMTANSTLGSTSSLATIIGSSSLAITSYGGGNIDIGHLILTANSSMTPLSSAMPTTIIGGTPLTVPDFPAGLVTGISSGSVGGLTGVSGTTSESLAQQLESLRESGAKVVSWSVLYDSSPVQND